MAAFTIPTTGFAPQLYMSEIVDAVNERRLAAIASGATGLPIAIPATPASVQSMQGGAVKPIHLLIQELLEALAPKYVDHGAAYPVATPYTVTTWRSRAGLNASGFRRATAWANPAAAPAFSYGLIQTGDIAGYWIWQDIVAGIQALQWTRKQSAIVSVQSRGSYGTGASVAAAIADADARWAAASWTTSAYTVRSCFVGVNGIGPYDCIVNLLRSKLTVALSAAAPVAAECIFYVNIGLLGARAYYDFESWPQGWNAVESVAIAATGMGATMTGTTMESPTATPAASSGLGLGGESGSWASITHYALLQWTFSRT